MYLLLSGIRVAAGACVLCAVLIRWHQTPRRADESAGQVPLLQMIVRRIATAAQEASTNHRRHGGALYAVGWPAVLICTARSRR